MTSRVGRRRSAIGFRFTVSQPELTDPPHPEPPSDEPTPATAGSSRTMAAARCCSSLIAGNEMSVEDSV